MTDSPDYVSRAVPHGDPERRLDRRDQKSAYVSPWPLRERVLRSVWTLTWLVLAGPTPAPLNNWRILLLRLFGCKVTGRPYVSPTARIKVPWNLTLEDRACLGSYSEVYNLGPVVLRARCTVAQQAYLCGGTHDLTSPTLHLVVGPIDIGPDAFVGARAFILPGVVVGEGAVVGACGVVTKDVPAWTVVAGNPARVIGTREYHPNQGTDFEK